MHLADIDAPIAMLGQVLDPVAMFGPPMETVDAGIMGVHAGEDGRPGGDTCCPRTICLAKGNAFTGQPVNIGGDHMVISPGRDGIKALLVGYDKDDIGFFGRH